MKLPLILSSFDCELRIQCWVVPLTNIYVSFNLDLEVQKVRLDWITGNWYFIINNHEQIVMCTNSLEKCTIILWDVKEPSSIALDPTKG